MLERDFKNWTEGDDIQLESMIAEGKTIEEISAVLKRSPRHIQSRLRKIEKDKKQIPKLIQEYGEDRKWDDED
jgi:hypothetical protein